jgi:hypothetical protein
VFDVNEGVVKLAPFANWPEPFALEYHVYELPPPPAAVKAAVVPQPMVAFAAEGAAKAFTVIGTVTG